jgi:uncharacterized protein (TIGR00297 family)
MASSDWIYLGLFLLALSSLIMFSNLLRRLMRWPAETSRKVVHLLTGLLIATTPFLLQSMWPMILLGLLFAAVDYLAIRRGFFQGIHDTQRRTYGTVFYPISFVILVVLLWNHHRLVLVTSMLILAVADTLAAIIGQRVKNPVNFRLGSENKSLQGSITMAAATFVIVVLCLYCLPSLQTMTVTFKFTLWIGAVTAIIVTACEAISFKGSDNLSVPLGSAFSLHFMLTHATSDTVAFTIGLLLAFLIAAISFKVKFLDASGAAATFLLGTVVFGLGRWTFSIPMLVFFVFSSLLSKMGKKRKKNAESVFEKSSRRDLGQVLANGGIPGLLTLLWYFYHSDIFYLLFIGTLAAVTADTWSTELGILSKALPRSIITFRSVPVGTSGGISFLGTVGGALGALVLVSVGALLSPHASPRLISGKVFWIIFSAGLFASFVDSILGATVQAQFKCPKCGKLTEKRVHCSHVSTDFTRGIRWMNNDLVNTCCALSGMTIAWLGWHFLV